MALIKVVDYNIFHNTPRSANEAVKIKKLFLVRIYKNVFSIASFDLQMIYFIDLWANRSHKKAVGTNLGLSKAGASEN